jgi:hypothetical protein
MSTARLALRVLCVCATEGYPFPLLTDRCDHAFVQDEGWRPSITVKNILTGIQARAPLQCQHMPSLPAAGQALADPELEVAMRISMRGWLCRSSLVPHAQLSRGPRVIAAGKLLLRKTGLHRVTG